jgi:hypothetical protein
MIASLTANPLMWYHIDHNRVSTLNLTHVSPIDAQRILNKNITYPVHVKDKSGKVFRFSDINHGTCVKKCCLGKQTMTRLLSHKHPSWKTISDIKEYTMNQSSFNSIKSLFASATMGLQTHKNPGVYDFNEDSSSRWTVDKSQKLADVILKEIEKDEFVLYSLNDILDSLIHSIKCLKP